MPIPEADGRTVALIAARFVFNGARFLGECWTSG
jgi:hypothetical protein